MKSEKIIFKNQSNEELAGRLELPDTEPQAFAIFAHCFTCGKDASAATRIARAMASKGYGTLRFDFTGLGNSDGDFSNTNFSSNVGDLISAAQYLEKNFQAPKILIGHSLGGAAVLVAGTKIKSVKAIVAIAAPSDPGHVAHLFADKSEAIARDGAAEVNLAGRKFTVKKQFLDDISEQKLVELLPHLGKAVLIAHSPVDELVSVDHAAKIYTAAHHPKSYISLDKANHLLTRKEDSDWIAGLIAAWATRYVS